MYLYFQHPQRASCWRHRGGAWEEASVFLLPVVSVFVVECLFFPEKLLGRW